eukprot:6640151-Pyramimonas_sp.AAC.1
MYKNRRRAQAIRFREIDEDAIIGPREAPAAEAVKLDKRRCPAQRARARRALGEPRRRWLPTW